MQWARPARTAPPAAAPAPAAAASLPGTVAAGAAARPDAPPVARLAAVVSVDGVPSLALVTADAPRLVRAGDLLADGAAVLAVEERALVVRAAGIVQRLALAGPVVALASPASAASSAAPSLPPPGYGAMPMPPQADERVGSGNAAFRAAVEEKARSMRK